MPRVAIVCLACCIVTAALRAAPAHAVTPQSAEVRAAVERAVAYLRAGNGGERGESQPWIALALLNAGAHLDDPLIAGELEAMRKALDPAGESAALADAHTAAVRTVLLCRCDPYRDAALIRRLMQSLSARAGELSATPSAGSAREIATIVWALWNAAQTGCAAPQQTIEQAALALLKAQQEDGQFGVASSNAEEPTAPLPAIAMRRAVTGDCLAALFMAEDLLGLTPRLVEHDPALPPALRPSGASAAPPASSGRVDAQRVRDAIAKGNRWMRVNSDVNLKDGLVEALLALERYASYREAAEYRVEKEPRWYTEAALSLLRRQSADGGWSTANHDAPSQPTETAQAILFLTRAAQSEIAAARRFGTGTLVWAAGLPPAGAPPTARPPVASSVAASPALAAADALTLLETLHGDEYDRALDSLRALPDAERRALVSQQTERIIKLAEHADPKVRRAAMELLGSVRSMKHVPALIRGLADADDAVSREASRALLRMSRQPIPPPTVGVLTDAQRKVDIAAWTQWYRSLSPREIGP